MSGQGTRAGHLTLLPKIFVIPPWLHFKGSVSNFQELIRASVLTKRKPRNFDFGDMRSGQFCNFTIIRQCEDVQMPFIPKVCTSGSMLGISRFSYIGPLPMALMQF